MPDYQENTLNIENIVNHLGGGIFCCKNDDMLTILYASKSFYDMLGYKNSEITAFCGLDKNYVISREQHINWKKLGLILTRKGFVELELKLIKKDGHHIWTSCFLRLMIVEDGSQYFCGIIEDITQKRRSIKMERKQFETIKKAKKELAVNEERYRIIMEQVADPIFDYNFETHEFYCSPPFKENFGSEVSIDGLLDKLYHSDTIYKDDKSRVMNDMYYFINGLQPCNPEYRFKDINNNYRWYRIRCRLISAENGTPLRVIAFITDIDEQKRETLKLKERAERDLLSGLYNHVTTTDVINKIIEEDNKNIKKENQHALFLIDIDNFKNVNDKLGHLLGDELIEIISSKLKKQFREDDIVGRIGGDEFVVFLKNISENDVRRKAQVLQKIFHSTYLNDKNKYKVTGSIGIAFYPRDGENYHELLKKADIAMYSAKKKGKDSYCIYSKEIECEHEQHIK